MKFLSWMKSKIHGKDNTIKPDPLSSPASCSYDPKKEELSGSLLSIGTFGNVININREDDDDDLNKHASVSEESERFDLSIDKIFPELNNEQVADILAVCSGKDCSSRKSRSIYKKSISFLLKKAFLCGGGLTMSPIIKDRPFPDPNFDTSRMDKILNVLVRKKTQKYLEKTQTANDDDKGEASNANANANANNWVKTDSKYIVLDL